MTLRETEPERDAAALTALMRTTEPYATVTPASWLHRRLSVPESARVRAFVAEVDGQVVGESWAFVAWFRKGAALLHVAVHEPARGQGIGSALYDAALAHALTLGAPRIAAMFFETDADVAFAAARGFSELRAEQIAMLDPRTVTERPTVEVRSFIDADLREAHRIDDAATMASTTHEEHQPITWDEWEQQVLHHPLFTREGSFVAYADGEPAAVSMLTADPESGRSTNFFTGTLPEFRGRGLALQAKLASIEWAAANGITQISTTNDETNAPMLAINRRLGYRPFGRRVEVSRSAD